MSKAMFLSSAIKTLTKPVESTLKLENAVLTVGLVGNLAKSSDTLRVLAMDSDGMTQSAQYVDPENVGATAQLVAKFTAIHTGEVDASGVQNAGLRYLLSNQGEKTVRKSVMVSFTVTLTPDGKAIQPNTGIAVHHIVSVKTKRNNETKDTYVSETSVESLSALQERLGIEDSALVLDAGKEIFKALQKSLKQAVKESESK